ncbi:MAG: baseplate J/gp47 family protein [Candidatus Levyibacteriota bacterium]
MKMPSLSFFEKKEKPQYFLALILRDEKATGVVFETLSGVVKIVGSGEEYFSESIEEISIEELLDICDKSISRAESSLPENIETQKAIFALKENWVEDNKIKKDYLDKLKKVSDELSIVPIGFLVTTEAIVSLLQKEEGAPISTIFAQISKENAIVSLVKASKVLEAKASKIHESASFTVDTLLKHFEVPEILPSRVIIFTDQEKELSQEFIKHQWSKSLSFLHLPQVLTLPSNYDIKAVINGSAKQMGLAVSPVLMDYKSSDDIPELTKETTHKETEEEKPKEENSEENEEAKEANEEEVKIPDGEKTIEDKIHEEQSFPSEHFGFGAADIAKIEPKEVDHKIEKTEKKESGKEDDELKIETISKEETKVEPKLAIIEDDTKKSFPEFPEERKKDSSSPLRFLGSFAFIGGSAFASIKSVARSIINFLPIIRGNKILLIPGIVIILLIVFFIYYLFALRANIILSVDPKIEETKQSATFSTSSSTDVEKNLISGEFVTISEEGSTTITTSGKKEIGEAAKGKITLYSRFTKETTIKSGIVISAPNDLEFTVDDSIKIASASADASAEPTTATILVTAKKIGKEYNLPAGTKFSVEDLSTGDIIGKNDDPLSGGNKKEVTVVSEEDITRAEQDLIKELENKAKDELNNRIATDKILLPVFADASVSKADFSKDVDDESDKLTITGTVDYQALSYKKDDLVSFAKLLLKSKIPEGLTITEDNINVEVKDSKKKGDDEISANLNIKAALLPKIDQEKMVKEVAGKSVSDAEKMFKDLPQVTNITTSLFPRLPFIPKYLPRDPNKIKVTLDING